MKSILNKDVSLFTNYFSPKNPNTINLLQYLQGSLYQTPFSNPASWLHDKIIKPEYRPYLEKYFIGQPLKKSVELYQSDRSAKGKTDFNNLIKKLLPAVTVSGTFEKRANDALIQHSGLMCLDVDYKDNTTITNFDYLKAQLCNLDNVAYCGLSVSGKGYFIIIPILYPDKHEQHFDSLKNDFNSFGLLVDESCRDVSRLRGFSVDEKAYFNHDAVPYIKLFKPVPPPKTYKKFVAKTNVGTGAKVEKLIEEVCNQRIDLTFDYADWYSIGCAFANEFGEIGRTYFHLVSQFYPEYEHGKTDKQYNACLKSSSTATINTFYKLCGLKGVLIKNLCYPTFHPVKQSEKKQATPIGEPSPNDTAILFNKVLKIEKEYNFQPCEVERLFDDNLKASNNLPQSFLSPSGNYYSKINKENVIFYACYDRVESYENGDIPKQYISITSALEKF